VAGYRYALWRPQVNGSILKGCFVESAKSAGQQLYQIDAGPVPGQLRQCGGLANASARALWGAQAAGPIECSQPAGLRHAVASHLQAQAAMETAAII